MWMNRSRAVTRKKTSMADHRSQGQANPTPNHTKACSSLFGHPNFRAFTTKCLSGKETLKSPTSVLESKPFSVLGNTLSSHTHRDQTKCLASTCPTSKGLRNETEAKGVVGLAFIDSLKNESRKEDSSKPRKTSVIFGTQLRVLIPDDSSKPRKTSVIFGKQLRVQIPDDDCLPPSHFPRVASPKSPADFGIKTRSLHVSTNGATDSGILSQMNESAENFSMSEMELSEDYTCVICRGPNPKTTRIFDNCILESYCSLPNDHSNCASENFPSFCYTCKRILDLTKDIFIYRGEKAFCSHACRRQEMLLDGVGRSEFVDDLSIDIS